MNSRIKQLRITLGKNQKEFAKSIGLSVSGVSALENGDRNVTDKHIRLLVLTYHINENWLRTGEGDMFLPADNSTLSKLQQEHHLSDAAMSLLNNFFNLTDSEQEDFINLAQKVFNFVD